MITLESLPTEEQIKAIDPTLSYRVLYYRLFLQYLDVLRMWRASMEKRDG